VLPSFINELLVPTDSKLEIVVLYRKVLKMMALFFSKMVISSMPVSLYNVTVKKSTV